ncbi:MAG: YraN family protein [Eubacteriales bacterium]|nr:YraN family protein [Eubacteriales bacterium]
MTRYNKNLGDKGERVAALYLRVFGYKILETNYRRGHGEVDIIAKRGKIVAFVEVKTRTSDEYGLPSESVAYTKQKRIISAARCYISKVPDMDYRFDVIEVYGKTNGKRSLIKRINHIKDAFHL